ncbi:hypothetical protein EV714DRAFT_240523, partial [Schizophyllum commune]
MSNQEQYHRSPYNKLYPLMSRSIRESEIQRVLASGAPQGTSCGGCDAICVGVTHESKILGALRSSLEAVVAGVRQEESTSRLSSPVPECVAEPQIASAASTESSSEPRPGCAELPTLTPPESSAEDHIALFASLSGMDYAHPLPFVQRHQFWESRVRVLLNGMDDFVLLDIDSWEELSWEIREIYVDCATVGPHWKATAYICAGILIGIVILFAGLFLRASLKAASHFGIEYLYYDQPADLHRLLKDAQGLGKRPLVEQRRVHRVVSTSARSSRQRLHEIETGGLRSVDRQQTSGPFHQEQPDEGWIAIHSEVVDEWEEQRIDLRNAGSVHALEVHTGAARVPDMNAKPKLPVHFAHNDSERTILGERGVARRRREPPAPAYDEPEAGDLREIRVEPCALAGGKGILAARTSRSAKKGEDSGRGGRSLLEVGGGRVGPESKVKVKTGE